MKSLSTYLKKSAIPFKKLSDTLKSKLLAAKITVHNKLEEDNLPRYFQDSRDWNYDHYHSTVVSRNRWKAVCLWACAPLIGILFILMIFLVPTQHVEPFLVNHYENGLVTVKPMQQLSAPTNNAQVESDIIHYVVTRESYSSATYNHEYNTVLLLSASDIAKQYLAEQSSDNKQSPVKLLGNKGYRTVHVESVVFLDSDSQNKTDKMHQHRNLAQVDFTVTQHDKDTGGEKQLPYTALIGWDYRGAPDDPNIRWQNWAGFTVNEYTVQQRSVA